MDILALGVFAVGVMLFAGSIKGLVGVGLPTAALSMLTLSVDPRTSIALILFPMILSNAWQVWRMGHILRTLRRYFTFGVALAVLVFATVFVSVEANDRLIFFVLGLSIVAFCLVNLAFRVPAISDRLDQASQLVLGAVAGVLGGLSGVWAAPMAIYLSGRQVDKDEFVRATGMLIFLGSVPLLMGYWQQGLMTRELSIVSAVLVLPTLAGFMLGEFVRARLSNAKFRTVFLLVFLVMGLNLLRRAVF